MTEGGALLDRDSQIEESDDGSQEARTLESHLYHAGFGVFHAFLLMATGLATAADAIEIFGVSFVVPVAEDDLNLSTSDKGWLDASIFIGMLIGGYTWGSLADVFGRKHTLMAAMLFNGICGIISAFSPNFIFFLVFRLASGIGVGGSQPIVFSYISEFFTEKQRGPIIIILASCWQPGIIFTALFAWGLMGTEQHGQGVDFYIGDLHFVNWRLFLVICTIPALLSAIALVFLPETPAYLLHVKKLSKLAKVLKKIEVVNRTCGYCWFRKNEDAEGESLINSEEVLNEENESTSNNENCAITSASMSSHTNSSNKLQTMPLFLLIMAKAKKIVFGTVELFRRHYVRATLLLLVIWFTQSFGYYGLQLWFPEYFKKLIEDNCDLQNNTIGCTNATRLQYYQDTLYTALASLPGNIAGTVLINIIGGRIQLVGAMVLSTLSVFLIWTVPNTNGAVVGVSCVFSAVTVTVFGSLDVILMNIYDVRVRSTAFGVHSGIGRIGAILGNVMFGHLLDVNKAIPILVVASLLSLGALSAAFLPPVYRPENQPPLLKLFHKLKKRCTLKVPENATTYGLADTSNCNKDNVACTSM